MARECAAAGLQLHASMRNKTQRTSAASGSDAKEQRSRKADVGEAAEQRGPNNDAGNGARRQQKPNTPIEGPARGRVTK